MGVSELNELNDIRQRVTDLEVEIELRKSRWDARRAGDLFAMVDRDLADLRAMFSGHRRVLQASRDTQFEQGRELAEHGEALTALRKTQVEHGEALGTVMDELRAHGRILARLDPGDRPEV